MAQTPEASIGTAEASQLDFEDELALIALDRELDQRLKTNSQAAKQRIEDHLEAAKHVTGGRGYEFGGATVRSAGGVALDGMLGVSGAMPFMANRRRFGNPYISRRTASAFFAR